MKWFPLTDPLVRWPEGAHTRYSGKQRQVIVQTKEMMHLLALSVLRVQSVGSSEAEQASASYMKRPCQRNATPRVRSTPSPCLL